MLRWLSLRLFMNFCLLLSSSLTYPGTRLVFGNSSPFEMYKFMLLFMKMFPPLLLEITDYSFWCASLNFYKKLWSISNVSLTFFPVSFSPSSFTDPLYTIFSSFSLFLLGNDFRLLALCVEYALLVASIFSHLFIFFSYDNGRCSRSSLMMAFPYSSHMLLGSSLKLPSIVLRLVW
jgi:hypothetical protein